MRVVLDTNSYFGDWYLENPAFRVFLDRLPRMDGLLLVPQIILDEVVTKFGDEVRRLDEIGRKYDAKYDELFGEKEWEAAGQHKVDEACSNYRERLLERMPLQKYWRLLPYPVDHATVVQRALQRRRPFDDDGRSGYRDALLWETILAVVGESEDTIHFVSNDRRAFYAMPEKKDTFDLHPDLKKDLEEKGLPSKRIQLFPTLDHLNQALVLPELPRRDDLFAPLKRDDLQGFSLVKWAHNALLYMIPRLGVEFFVPIRRGAVRVEFPLLYPQHIEILSIDDVLQLSSGNLLVSATITADFRVEINANSDQLAAADVQELFGEFLVRGDNVASLGMTLDVKPKIAVTIILERETLKVLAATIDEVAHSKISFTFHPHPIRS